MIDIERLKTEKTLGCGCSTFGGSVSKKNALTALNHCFDQGILYYDVARSYGYGNAESILSGFIGDKRKQLLISSKFGISAPSSFLLRDTMAVFLRAIKNNIPASHRMFKNLSRQVLNKKSFTPQMVVDSLNKSLSELKTSYLDIFIYHESTYSEILNNDVKNALNKEKEKGKIRMWGVNVSDHGDQEMVLKNNIKTSVLQLPFALSNAYFKLTHRIDQVNIIYSVMSSTKRFKMHDSSAMLLQIKTKHPQLKQINTEIELLLYLAYHQIPNGIVLFSTVNPAHIRKNIEISQIPPLDNMILNELKISIKN